MSNARTRIAASILGAVLLLVGGVAYADPMTDLQNQRDANATEQERLSSELEGTDAGLQTAYLELARIDGELPIAEAELTAAQEAVAAAERHQTSVADRLAVAQTEASTLSSEIETAKTEISDTQDGIGELARSRYRGGDELSALTIVLGASDPQDFASRTSAVNSAMRSQGQVLDELETTAATQRNSQARLDAVNIRIGELKVEADAAVVAADAARTTAQERKTTLDNLRVSQVSKAAELETLKSAISDQQAQLAADDLALAGQIQALAEEQRLERERQAAEAAAAQAAADAAKAAADAAAAAANQGSGSSGSGSGSSGSGSSGSGSGSSGSGSSGSGSSGSGSSGSGSGSGSGSSGGTSGLSLVPPVPAPFYVTSPFGMRIYPITGGRYMHNGTDIRSSCGNTQVSAADGRVIGVRNAAGNGTHGNQVLVDHGVINGQSVVSVYNHLSRFAVSSGQSISQGQAIGYTGMTGAVTGCHVHVEIWINGTAINPESLPGWNRS